MLDDASLSCLGGGDDQRAAIEIGLLVLWRLGSEDCQDHLSRMVEPIEGLVPADRAARPDMRRLGNPYFRRGCSAKSLPPGAPDGPIDADRLDALGVEELVSSLEPALSSLGSMLCLSGCSAHGYASLPDNSVSRTADSRGRGRSSGGQNGPESSPRASVRRTFSV